MAGEGEQALQERACSRSMRALVEQKGQFLPACVCVCVSTHLWAGHSEAPRVCGLVARERVCVVSGALHCGVHQPGGTAGMQAHTRQKHRGWSLGYPGVRVSHRRGAKIPAEIPVPPHRTA